MICARCKKPIEGKPARTSRKYYLGPHGARLSNHEKAFCAPCVAEMDAVNERYRKEVDEKTARDVAKILKRIKTPALWKCDCGQVMECEGFTNTCPKCGTDYNWGGQHLAPRSCWGEETGEYPSDIAALR